MMCQGVSLMRLGESLRLRVEAPLHGEQRFGQALRIGDDGRVAVELAGGAA